MEANLLLMAEWSAIESGTWIVTFLEWLSVGAGVVLIGTLGSVAYENLEFLRQTKHGLNVPEGLIRR